MDHREYTRQRSFPFVFFFYENAGERVQLCPHFTARQLLAYPQLACTLFSRQLALLYDWQPAIQLLVLYFGVLEGTYASIF